MLARCCCSLLRLYGCLLVVEWDHLQPLSHRTIAGVVPPFRTQEAGGGWSSSDTLQLSADAGKKLDL